MFDTVIRIVFSKKYFINFIWHGGTQQDVKTQKNFMRIIEVESGAMCKECYSANAKSAKSF